jgi:hypothetical protein
MAKSLFETFTPYVTMHVSGHNCIFINLVFKMFCSSHNIYYKHVLSVRISSEAGAELGF